MELFKLHCQYEMNDFEKPREAILNSKFPVKFSLSFTVAGGKYDKITKQSDVMVLFRPFSENKI